MPDNGNEQISQETLQQAISQAIFNGVEKANEKMGEKRAYVPATFTLDGKECPLKP